MATIPPALVVISEFGGVCATARALKRNRSSVSRWLATKENNGTGGLVPSGLQREILEIAQAQGIYLTPRDLIFGREVSNE